jgi:hypothetical protein
LAGIKREKDNGGKLIGSICRSPKLMIRWFLALKDLLNKDLVQLKEEDSHFTTVVLFSGLGEGAQSFLAGRAPGIELVKR